MSILLRRWTTQFFGLEEDLDDEVEPVPEVVEEVEPLERERESWEGMEKKRKGWS